MKLIKRIALIILALVVLGIGLLYFIGQAYKEEITRLVENEINQQVTAKVQVKNIELDILSALPDISVALNRVLIYSTPNYTFNTEQKDTLFCAQKVLFSFRLFDLLSGTYRLDKFHVEKGFLHMKVNARGSDNFRIIESGNNDSNSSFQLDLRKVILKDFAYRYTSSRQKNDIWASTEKLSASGNFSNKGFSIKTKGKLKLKSLKISNINYIEQYEAKVYIEALIDDKALKVQEGALQLGHETFNVTGSYTFDQASWLDILIQSDKINLAHIQKSIPKAYNHLLKNYKAKGSLDLQMNIKGAVSKRSTPIVKIKALLKEALIQNTQNNMTLNINQLKASYQSENASVILEDFTAKILDTKLDGHMTINNIRKPRLKGAIRLKANLNNLQYFSTIDSLFDLKGEMKGELDFELPLKKGFKIDDKQINKIKTQGNMQINKGSISLKTYNNQTIRNINIRCLLQNNKWEIQELTAENTCCKQLQFTGVLYNLLPWSLSKDKDFNINGECSIDSLNLSCFLEQTENKSDEKHQNTSFFFPEKMAARVQMQIAHFEFNKFKASQIETECFVNKRRLSFSNLSLNTSQGELSAFAQLERESDKTYLLKTKGQIRHIDIQNLMYQFDDFGQETVKHENIKGYLDADFVLESLLDPSFQFKSKSIKSELDLTLTNGSLLHYKPLYSLSKFIDLEELENIRFQEIRNHLEIQDNILQLPKMSVRSSAVDFKLSGEHHFRGQYKYRINVLLSEILGRKARKKKANTSEFSYIKDDGRGRSSLFLILEGNEDDFSIKYDTKSVKEHIKEEFKKEKTNLKSILNKEFGLFKKDSSLIEEKKKKKTKKKSTKENFKIQWDE